MGSYKQPRGKNMQIVFFRIYENFLVTKGVIMLIQHKQNYEDYY